MRETREKNKKESMLIDWLLVALYFVVVLVLAVSIYLRKDFLIEFAIPGILIVAVSAIFFNYLNKIIHTHPEEEEKKNRG